MTLWWTGRKICPWGTSGLPRARICQRKLQCTGLGSNLSSCHSTLPATNRWTLSPIVLGLWTGTSWLWWILQVRWRTWCRTSMGLILSSSPQPWPSPGATSSFSSKAPPLQFLPRCPRPKSKSYPHSSSSPSQALPPPPSFVVIIPVSLHFSYNPSSIEHNHRLTHLVFHLKLFYLLSSQGSCHNIMCNLLHSLRILQFCLSHASILLTRCGKYSSPRKNLKR